MKRIYDSMSEVICGKGVGVLTSVRAGKSVAHLSGGVLQMAAVMGLKGGSHNIS